MRVKVKLVMFCQRTIHEEGDYGGYCPALNAFHVFDSSSKLIAYMEGRLKRDLEGRIHYNNMKDRGWEVSENSAIPPIFTDEELIKQTEELFEIKIKDPIIVELSIELPKAIDRYAHLPNTHKNP